MGNEPEIEDFVPEHKNAKYAGKFGVANSAGVIDIYKDGPDFPTLVEAKKQADIESRRGWLGECWAVRFIAPKPEPAWVKQSRAQLQADIASDNARFMDDQHREEM